MSLTGTPYIFIHMMIQVMDTTCRIDFHWIIVFPLNKIVRVSLISIDNQVQSCPINLDSRQLQVYGEVCIDKPCDITVSSLVRHPETSAVDPAFAYPPSVYISMYFFYCLAG